MEVLSETSSCLINPPLDGVSLFSLEYSDCLPGINSSFENSKHKEDESSPDEVEDYSTEDISEAKFMLMAVFENSKIVDDVPLRVKMQNHGAWITFDFILNNYSCFKSGNVGLVRRAVQELDDIFEIKDMKFRRKEMLPDIESIIYQRSILFISKIGDIDYADIKDLFKEIVSSDTELEKAYYRLIKPKEKVFTRDVGLLMKRCPDNVKDNCFVWLELVRGKDISKAMSLLLSEKFHTLWSEKFEAHILQKLMAQHAVTKSRSDAQRNRGVTVSGTDFSRSSKSKFQFKSKNGSSTELDWLANRQSAGQNNTDTSQPSTSASNSRCSNKSSVEPPEVCESIRNRASHLLSSNRLPRRRLTNSESASASANENAHFHERPHLNLVKSSLNSQKNHGSGLANGLNVTTIRQPNGPSGMGFQRFVPNLTTLSS